MAFRSSLSGLIRQKPLRNPEMVVLTLRRQLYIKGSNKKLFTGRHKMDKVPSQFSVIYNSTLGPWFTMFRIGMGTISAVMAVVYYNIIPEISTDFFASSEGFFICGSTLFFIFITTAFSISARRFFTRIYYHADSGNFIGVKRDLFGRLKQVNYTVKDIKPLAIKSAKSEDGSETTFVSIKGQKVQLHGRHFISTVFYNMHFSRPSSDSELFREPNF